MCINNGIFMFWKIYFVFLIKAKVDKGPCFTKAYIVSIYKITLDPYDQKTYSNIIMIFLASRRTELSGMDIVL